MSEHKRTSNDARREIGRLQAGGRNDFAKHAQVNKLRKEAYRLKNEETREKYK